MALTKEQLAVHLPGGAISGNSLSFGALSSVPTTIVGWLVGLLDGVAKLTEDVNTIRAAATPPLDPIDLATKSVSIDGDIVQIAFTVNFIGSLSNINSTVTDPTDPPPTIATTPPPSATPSTPAIPGAGTSPGIPGVGVAGT